MFIKKKLTKMFKHYTQYDVFIIRVQGENGRRRQTVHVLVIPDYVVFPPAIHKLLIINRKYREPGVVILVGNCMKI